MQDKLIRPFRPLPMADGELEYFALQRLAEDLRSEPVYEKNGRNALTLVRNEEATVVLTAIRAGTGLDVHRAPAVATVVVLEGAIEFQPDDLEPQVLKQHQSAVFGAQVAHAVHAQTDAILLIVIGGSHDGDDD